MKLKNTIIEYAGLTLGCMIMAIGLSMFLIPHTIAPGGISGLSIVISKLTGIQVSTLLFSISALFLIFSIKILGKNDAIKTFIGLVIATITLKIAEPLSSIVPTENTMLAAIVGAILVGIALGIIFRVDASTGGTDLIALMLNRIFPFVSVSKWLSIIDGSIVIFAGIANKNFETSVYSAIALYIMVHIIDKIISGFDYAKAFFIITEKEELMKEKIINDLNRGITILDGTGGYTGDEKNVMLVVVNNKKQEIALKKLVKTVDKKSFVIVTDVYEVLGNGFKPIE